MEEGSEGYGPHETEILKLKYNGGVALKRLAEEGPPANAGE